VKLKKLVATALTVGAVLSASACSGVKPEPDSIILYYKAGTGDDKRFQECVPGGTTGPWSADNQVFELPRSLRTWNIREDGSGDSKDPIRSGSLPNLKDNVSQPGAEVAVWTSVDFYLNTFCGADNKDPNSPIVQFWEQTGRRKWNGKSIADDGEGKFNEDAWATMLRNTLVTAEEKAIRAETRKYTADVLDANIDGVYQKMEQQLGRILNAEVKAKVGGDYFCGAGYKGGAEVEWSEWVADGTDDKGEVKVKEIVKKGTCPPVRVSVNDVNLADKKIADARAEVFAAEQRAKAALIDAQSKVDVANKLKEANPEVILELERLKTQLAIAQACASNPNCTLIVDTAGGADVTVTPGKK
jgi:hypothetical protein